MRHRAAALVIPADQNLPAARRSRGRQQRSRAHPHILARDP